MSELSIGNQRLLKLAEHLEKGKLGHRAFDFSQYNDVDINVCGTAGCAIGECPIVFPKEWVFSESGTPCLKSELNFPIASGKSFFTISNPEFYHLFFPTEQRPEIFGGKVLGYDATRKQVAKNIRAFVALKTAS